MANRRPGPNTRPIVMSLTAGRISTITGTVTKPWGSISARRKWRSSLPLICFSGARSACRAFHALPQFRKDLNRLVQGFFEVQAKKIPELKELKARIEQENKERRPTPRTSQKLPFPGQHGAL